MVKDTKLYDILELSPNATDDDIQKQYKLLAKKWHPDKNKDRLEEATKKTQELNEAKEILLNPEKRKLYDQFGLDMANGNAAAGPNPEDLFNMFGGGFSGFGGRREPEKENIVISVSGIGSTKDFHCLAVNRILSINKLFSHIFNLCDYPSYLHSY